MSDEPEIETGRDRPSGGAGPGFAGPPRGADAAPLDGSPLSLVIPVLNERESLPQLLAEIEAAVQGIGVRTEVIFVDDGSTDGSWEVIRKLALSRVASAPGGIVVRAIRFRRNFGKASALAAGFNRATGGVVMTLDADLQDDPKEIPRFLAAVAGGTDVVSGWKKVRHDPWHKVFPSRVFNGLVSALTGVKLHDHNCGFKAYRADVTREVRLYGEFHRFVPVLAAAEGFTVGELVIHHRPRKYGYSKFGAKRFIKGILDLLTVRLLTAFGHRPKHALGTLGLTLAAAGAVGFTGFAVLFGVEPFGPSRLGFRVTILGILLSLLTIVVGQTAFFTGLLAEFVLARTPGGPPYRIADSIDPPRDDTT